MEIKIKGQNIQNWLEWVTKELDFTLTMLGWMGLFVIFYSLWYDILN